MYLTFEQALSKIKDKKPKNTMYAETRIRMLIKDGELQEAKPEIYLKHDDGNLVKYENIIISRLVTENSVKHYIEIRKQAKKLYGVIPKKSTKLKAVFLDGTQIIFDSINNAHRFFNIDSRKITKSFRNKTFIEVPIHETRRFDISPDIKTENVRFYLI
jgi:uncharacterized protein YaiL (DUF2058 family)